MAWRAPERPQPLLPVHLPQSFTISSPRTLLPPFGGKKKRVFRVCVCVCACYLYPDIRVTWHLMDSAMWNKRPRLITLPRPWPFWSSSFPLGQKPILHDCVCERERETECVNAHLSERASHCCSNPLKLNQIQALRSKKQVFCCGSLRRCSRRRLEAKR